MQAVAFVGNLYKYVKSEGYLKEDGPCKDSKEKYVLMIGMSKQHPCDTKVNKNLGFEIATVNAMDDPIIMVEVQGKFTYRRFKNIVENYLSNVKLEFIKTRQELINEGKNPKNYNR